MRRGRRFGLTTDAGAGPGGGGLPEPKSLDCESTESCKINQKPKGGKAKGGPEPEPPEPEAASAGQDSAWANAAALAGGPERARGALGA